MSALKRNLRIAWDETGQAPGHAPDPRRRYVVRGNGNGFGWGVFDKQAARFLKDSEVRAMTPAALRSLMPAN